MLNISITMCYRFLADCNRESWCLCLDWRQICNGKVDCMNGEDEQWCGILEMTTCADDEYRCHYDGQCIPMAYARDGTVSIDCLDGSEEVESYYKYISLKNYFCGSRIVFRCDERIDRYALAFPCGNSEFFPTAMIPVNINGCSNKQNREVALTMFTSFHHIKDSKCQQAFRCSLLSNRSYISNAAFLHVEYEFFQLYHVCSTTGNEMSCANSSYFHCNTSLRCISYNRVGDGFRDCLYNEDESFSACHLNDSNRFMCPSDPTKCLSLVAIGDGINNCPKGEDETENNIYGIQRPIPFSSICDITPYIEATDGNETDETNCEWWPYDTAYSHCDALWDCHNGIDELNCPDTNCSLNEFQCKSEYLNLTYCLPLVHMFHKRKDDCTDNNVVIQELYFDNRTSDISKYFYSFNKSKCITEDNICNHHSERANVQKDICLKSHIRTILVDYESQIYQVDNRNTYLCSLQPNTGMLSAFNDRFLSPLRLSYYPSITSTTSNQNFFKKSTHKNDISQMDAALAWYCHYGALTLFKGINKTKACLCPQNYFGSQCQWQSQRVCLTLQFRKQSKAWQKSSRHFSYRCIFPTV
ncbi:unnamed protein product [Rotaria sp. Silwood2]|nr:unnamed protein product [Rotaria sp. Silwood2]